MTFLRSTLCIVLVSMLALAAGAQDWPSFVGTGDRTPPREGVALVDDLEDATVLWELDHFMGVGKGLYPKSMRYAEAEGVEPFYGGTSSPVVAGGRVYVSYHKPDGEVAAERMTWRTMGDPEVLALLPEWFWSVTAEDRLLAVDAKTGEVAWEAVESGGLNRLGHKRGHWGVSPAYAEVSGNPMVFSLGTAGTLRAYDAATGERRWETLARPELAEQLEEAKAAGRLVWDGREKSSPVVAGGNVIVSAGGLRAFDAATGEPRWSTWETLGKKAGGRVISRWATPATWHHGEDEYLLVNDGSGTARLLDAADGSVLWTLEGLANQLGTIDVTGDVAIMSTRSEAADDEKRNALFGAFRLSRDGAEKMWTLPDEPGYRHSWTLDRGAERRAAVWGDRVYMVVGIKPLNQLITVDLSSGKILSQENINGIAPYPMEDHLLVYADRAHTDKVTASWWSLEDPDRPVMSSGVKAFPMRTITGYEVPIEWPVVDGVLYARTFRGLAAISLRKPTATAENKTLRMTIPGEFLGLSRVAHATLTQRDGRLTHGSFRESGDLHAINTSDASWDGRRVTGTLWIDTRGERAPGRYEIDAGVDPATADGAGDGAGEAVNLRGTITSRVPAFDTPSAWSGLISAMEHQDHWMAPATHVLRLEHAAIQRGGKRGRLLLLITARDGRLERVTGWADQTTQTPPVIDPSGLTLEGEQLTGTVRVRYRPDRYTAPLTEEGDTAAAAYEIEARLGDATDGHQVGQYLAIYGVAWEQTVELIGDE